MLWVRPSPRPGLADVLASLPGGYRWLEAGAGYLVVGPTGAFMVGEGGRNAGTAARQLAHLAGRCRSGLARVLSWAPFVDVLVVADRAPGGVPAASIVPSHMLIDTLTCGPVLMDTDTVDRIATLAEELVSDPEPAGTPPGGAGRATGPGRRGRTMPPARWSPPSQSA